MEDMRVFCEGPDRENYDNLPLPLRVRLADAVARTGDQVAEVVASAVPASVSNVLPAELTCLSVRQPAATLLVDGLKRVENRSKKLLDPTRWELPLACLIAASAGAPLDIKNVTRSETVRERYGSRDLPRGKIIGAVLFTAILHKSDPEIRRLVGARQVENYVYGPWVFVAGSAVALPVKVPYKGRLGFYSVPVGALGPSNVDALEEWVGVQPEAFLKRRRNKR